MATFWYFLALLNSFFHKTFLKVFWAGITVQQFSSTTAKNKEEIVIIFNFSAVLYCTKKLNKIYSMAVIHSSDADFLDSFRNNKHIYRLVFLKTVAFKGIHFHFLHQLLLFCFSNLPYLNILRTIHQVNLKHIITWGN